MGQVVKLPTSRPLRWDDKLRTQLERVIVELSEGGDFWTAREAIVRLVQATGSWDLLNRLAAQEAIEVARRRRRES